MREEPYQEIYVPDKSTEELSPSLQASLETNKKIFVDIPAYFLNAIAPAIWGEAEEAPYSPVSSTITPSLLALDQNEISGIFSPKSNTLIQAAMENDVLFLETKEITNEDLLTEDPSGDIPLIHAVANNANLAALMLLEFKCPEQINYKSSTSHGRTALILSISKGFDCKDSYGITQEMVANRLLEYKANPNLQDSSGRTALHYACLHRNIRPIQLLVEYEARWNVRDQQGYTPLELFLLDNQTRNNFFNLTSKTAEKLDLFSIKEIESPHAQIEILCTLLYKQAKQIFLKNAKYQKDLDKGERDWQQFEENVTRKEAMWSASEFSGPDIDMKTTESTKAAYLLKVYLKLKNIILKTISEKKYCDTI